MTETFERASKFAQDLSVAMKQNPVSAALVGMGAFWLFANGARSLGASPVQRVADAATEVWKGASSNLQSSSEGIQSGISSMSGAVADRAGAVPELVESTFSNTRASVAKMLQQQPLALGVIGLAIGAAVASSLPATEAEKEYLGETSSAVKEKLSEIAGENAERVTEVGMKVFQAVTDEAQKQGLTPESVKSAASELAEKATRLGTAVRS